MASESSLPADALRVDAGKILPNSKVNQGVGASAPAAEASKERAAAPAPASPQTAAKAKAIKFRTGIANDNSRTLSIPPSAAPVSRSSPSHFLVAPPLLPPVVPHCPDSSPAPFRLNLLYNLLPAYQVSNCRRRRRPWSG